MTSLVFKSYLNNIKKNNEIAFFRYNPEINLNVPNARNSCFINALYFSSIIDMKNMPNILKRREESIIIINNVAKIQSQISNKEQQIKQFLPYTKFKKSSMSSNKKIKKSLMN